MSSTSSRLSSASFQSLQSSTPSKVSSTSYRPNIKNIELDITIFRARNLIANDGSLFGKKKSSDPYVRIFWGGEKCGKTKAIGKNLSPEWNENFKINVESKYMQKLVNGDPSYSVVDVIVFDKDKFSKDDPLGTVSIPLTFMENPTSLPATWYTLGKGKDPYVCKKASGEIELKIVVLIDKATKVIGQMIGIGESIRLNDQFYGSQIPDLLTVQTCWEITRKTKIDPHASAICFDHYLNLIDIASINELRTKDGAIFHSNELFKQLQTRNKDSEENINLSFAQVNSSVTYICILVNCFKGKNLDAISNFSCSLMSNSATENDKQIIAEYKHSKSSTTGKHSAVLLCCFYRYQTSNVWTMRAMGNILHGRTTNHAADELQDILHQNISFTEQPPLKHSTGPRADLVVDC